MLVTTNKATIADIPLLVEMMREFYAESDYSLDEQWATESFTAFLQNDFYGAIWLVSVNSKPAGYIVMTVRFSMEYGGLDASIDDLFVRPSYRRQGLGQALINQVLAECKHRKLLALQVEVGHDNFAAKELYQSNGLHLRDDERQVLTMQFKES